MKKTVKFLSVSIMALTIVSCQEDPLNGSSEEGGVREVTTQFMLNIASAPTTKMTAEAVQQNQNFRGIQDANLFAYKTEITSGTPYILSESATPEKHFDFGNFFSADALDNTLDSNKDPNNETGNNEGTTASKRVLQLSIPVGVDAVLFYGKATKAANSSDAAYGATNTASTTISGTPGSTVIAAQRILTDGDVVDSYDATARLMIAVINDILVRGVGATTHETFGELPAVTWAQYGHRYELDTQGDKSRYTVDDCIDHPVEGLEEVLGRCYYLFTYILPVSISRPHGEYRAGSSFAIKKMVMDMYRVVSAAAGATPTTAYEANAQRVAKVVLDRAKLYFNTDTTDGTPDGNYESIETIKDLLVTQYEIFSETQWTTNFNGAKDLNKFPYEDFGVPEGAAQLGFYKKGDTRAEKDGGGTALVDQFYYYHPNHPLVNPEMADFEPRKYVYPAELWYYVNSPIRTTSNDVTASSFPDGVTPWNTSAWTGWTYPGKVEGSTRGVAVANSINYGVAMLKTSVKFDNVTKLYDNRKALTNNKEENKAFTPSTSLFELRGVLVGGVNPRMNWQFTRKYTSSGNHEGIGDLSKFDGVIYDHTMANSTVPTPDKSPNYTLVYDNYNSSEVAGNQNSPYIALEFVNKGEDFYGRDNMIPSGGVFYLVAQLEKPTAEQESALAWPTDHQIPPLDADGASKKIARVFIQDFVTSATFLIGAESLQKAYYTVPDLRASQMSLGLSVDLQWNTGLSYEKVL